MGLKGRYEAGRIVHGGCCITVGDYLILNNCPKTIVRYQTHFVLDVLADSVVSFSQIFLKIIFVQGSPSISSFVFMIYCLTNFTTLSLRSSFSIIAHYP